MTRKADLVPAGTTFTATIRATNVTPIMLKLLLAAVDPGDYLQSQTRRPGAAYAVHLGGGRPLGLGSATVTARLVDIDEARSRYVAGSEPKDTDEQETRLRTWGPAERVDPGSEALARLLDLNGLGDWAANVHYHREHDLGWGTGASIPREFQVLSARQRSRNCSEAAERGIAPHGHGRERRDSPDRDPEHAGDDLYQRRRHRIQSWLSLTPELRLIRSLPRAPSADGSRGHSGSSVTSLRARRRDMLTGRRPGGFLGHR